MKMGNRFSHLCAKNPLTAKKKSVYEREKMTSDIQERRNE